MKTALPGPRQGLPLFGPTLAVLRLARDPLTRMGRLFDRYGDIVGLTREGGTRVFSTDPDCPGTVLGRGADFVRTIEMDGATYHRNALSGRLYPHGRTGERNRALREWATGLFAVNGQEHRRHRRLIAPAFLPRRTESWATDVCQITTRATSKWTLGATVDIHAAMMEITLRVATRSFFGEEIGTQGIIARTQEQSLKSVLSPLVLFAPYDLPGLPYRRFLNNVVAFNREMHRLVADRRAEGAIGDDVISALIQARDDNGVGMTDGEVVGHASVIFAAGHETTSNALTWVIFFLSQHPDVAAQVVDEITSVLRGAPPTVGDLKAMPLLERVILESLRVMPPAPWNTRTTSQDTELLGCDLASGTEVIASVFHTHRIPEVWPDARRFVPRRWETASPSPYEFNPFGGGARSCPGETFAMMEMRLIVAILLSRFRLELAPEAQVDPVVNITMSLRRGLPMTVRPAGTDWVAGKGAVRGRVHLYVDLPE